MELIEKYIGEATVNETFKVGQFVYHKDFDNGNAKLKVVKVHDDDKRYNTVEGTAGIRVEYKGNKYDLWFDTETLRKEKRAGKKSLAYNKLVQ